MSTTNGEPSIAVAHYPEGAGHATRMLAVADALEAAGAVVSFAGGGAGARFVALNGYDAFEPTAVDYIDTYQGGSLRRVLAESVPATAARVAEFTAWLRETNPDALVTDDMFAAMAAHRTGTPLYVLKHDVPALYDDRVERAGARFHTGFQLTAAREFFYPTVWPASARDPAGVTHTPPVALEGAVAERGDHDVVVVPSHYSELGRIADALDRAGYDVVDVGSDEWNAVPSLLPYLRAADVVVCSGYSTVMDAAVAGTPCVVHPATDEQDAVADWLGRFDVDGFAVAPEPMDVLEAVADPPEAPAYENGASTIAERVLADLDDAATAEGTAADGDGSLVPPGRSGRVGRGVADGAVAGRAALGTALRAGALRGLRAATDGGRRVAAGAARLRRAVVASTRRIAAASRAAGAAAAARLRATSAACARYAVATAAVAAAALVFARGGARRTGRSALGCAEAAATAVRAGTRPLKTGAVTVARGCADAGRRLVDRAAGAVDRLRAATRSSP
jgi:hypothetical protein